MIGSGRLSNLVKAMKSRDTREQWRPIVHVPRYGKPQMGYPFGAVEIAPDLSHLLKCPTTQKNS